MFTSQACLKRSLICFPLKWRAVQWSILWSSTISLYLSKGRHTAPPCLQLQCNNPYWRLCSYSSSYQEKPFYHVYHAQNVEYYSEILQIWNRSNSKFDKYYRVVLSTLHLNVFLKNCLSMEIFEMVDGFFLVRTWIWA